MQHHTCAEFASGHQFLEGLRWHDGRLWASDFFGRQVMTFDGDGVATTVAVIDGAPSGLGFLADGTPLVVSQAGATVERIAADGTTSTFAEFGSIAGGPGNDMLVTSEGHVYVGNFGFAIGTEDPKPTQLGHIAPDGTLTAVEGDVFFPNGMAVTPGGKFLLAETFRHRITCYDVAADGSLSNQRVWAQLDEAYNPDGIALDSDGGVWFGNALVEGDASGFYRVVEGGELTDKIPVPDAQAIACAFGGDDLDTLYLTCNATTLADFVQGRSTATIATASVGRRGAPGSAGA